MTLIQKITDKTTIRQIRDMLSEDGYAHLLERAADIKRAAKRGTLLWTKERLVTTDNSRINTIPIR
jgi:hypothetical protein